VESAEDAAVAVRSLGRGVWPVDREGARLTALIIENQQAVARAAEIARAPGVGVIIAGPGDLRSAYEGDMAAVEKAIQTVLAACKQAGVPCGITAGPEDVAKRLQEGFRLFIVTDPATIEVGRRLAGQTADAGR
jgi:2-keto-3-deoxy-L-rhamnonate aldolase RhmA